MSSPDDVSSADLFSRINELSKEVAALRQELVAQNRHLHQHTAGILRTERARIDSGTQFLMAENYRQKAEDREILPFDEVEFSNYSQNGEDGVLHYIFSLVGKTNKKVLEICAGAGSECNAANLILHQGWSGLLIEGDAKKHQMARNFFARHMPLANGPVILNYWVDRDSINDIVSKCDFSGEIDLFSLDMDGVDYWILEALDSISPRVVIVEAQFSWGPDISVTVPYKDDFVIDRQRHRNDGSGFAYAGASIPAFTKLAKSRGYRLAGKVGANGPNIVFLRDDVGADYFPAVEPERLFKDMPPVYLDQFTKYRDAAKNYDWITI